MAHKNKRTSILTQKWPSKTLSTWSNKSSNRWVCHLLVRCTPLRPKTYIPLFLSTLTKYRKTHHHLKKTNLKSNNLSINPVRTQKTTLTPLPAPSLNKKKKATQLAIHKISIKANLDLKNSMNSTRMVIHLCLRVLIKVISDIGIEPDKIKERVLLVLKFKAPDYDTI